MTTKLYFFLTISAILISSLFCEAQNMELYKRIVKELSSDVYQGRGYADNGVIKAGKFVENEFRKAGADEVVTQSFSIDVNTFPGAMEMAVDGKSLEAGKDFVMREYSPGVHGEYQLYYIDTLNYNPDKIFDDLSKPENKDVFVVCDFWFTYKHKEDFNRIQSKERCQSAGVVYTWKTPLKYYKAYSNRVVDKPIIWVGPDFPKNAERIKVNIDNAFLKDYTSNNVIAKVSGERHDSCFVFSAHYDHLGKLGKDVFYPGANDNASGTACIITLTEYYSCNKPVFDIYFIAFAGEDTGLNGSTWFVEHPLFPLQNIKYLFNLDMIGDNNRVQYCEISPEAAEGFNIMKSVNETKNCFESLKLGSLAANSDHYPFSQKSVPCIMFENEEGDAFKYYHTPLDNWENAIFSTYIPIFTLTTEFVKQF